MGRSKLESQVCRSFDFHHQLKNTIDFLDGTRIEFVVPGIESTFERCKCTKSTLTLWPIRQMLRSWYKISNWPDGRINDQSTPFWIWIRWWGKKHNLTYYNYNINTLIINFYPEWVTKVVQFRFVFHPKAKNGWLSVFVFNILKKWRRFK